MSCTIEALEEMRKLTRLNCQAVIADIEHDTPVQRAGGDANVLAAIRYCVRQQIGENHLNARTINFEQWEIVGQINRQLWWRGAQTLQRSGEQVIEAPWLAMERKHTLLLAREVEQIAHEIIETIRLGADRAEAVPLLLGRPGDVVLQQGGGVSLD